MRSCRKKTGPGATSLVKTVITTVSTARKGSDNTQQIKSIPRFQTGKWLTWALAGALTDGGLQEGCMGVVSCSTKSITAAFQRILAGRLVIIYLVYDMTFFGPSGS